MTTGPSAVLSRMMEWANSAGGWLLAYLLVMVVHEAGHVLTAWMAGVRIDRVFLFYDANEFALCRWRVRKTIIGLGWLPLGAYTTISGMDDDGTQGPLPWGINARHWLVQVGIYASGAYLNLMTAAALWPWYDASVVIERVCIASIGLALLQLVPVGRSDGAYIMRTLRRALGRN